MKSIQTDRVLLEPADPLDVALVRHIFGLFVRKRLREADVARVLNWSCYPGRTGMHPWNAQAVRDVLRNEQYVGNLVYNRRSCSLKTPWVKNSPEKWVRAEHCFEGIVSQATFSEAQRLILGNNRHLWTDEEMLDLLKRVHTEHGAVSASLLRAHGFPDSTLYINHFGSLADACEAAGIVPSPRAAVQRRVVETRRALKVELLEAMAKRYRAIGVGFIWQRQTRRAYVEGGPTISVRSVQAFTSKSKPYWLVTPDRRVGPDLALVARVALDGRSILDYFLLPAAETRNAFIRTDGVAAHDWIDRYRYATLDDVVRTLELTRRARAGRMVPRLSVGLAKRRRRILGIKKRVDALSILTLTK